MFSKLTLLLVSIPTKIALASAFGNSTFTCLDNFHFQASADHNGGLELVDLEYGNCTLDSSAVITSTTENGGTKTFNFEINPFACMAQYSSTHQFSVGIGVKIQGSPHALVMEQLNFNGTCGTGNVHIVDFDYGKLTPNQHDFDHSESGSVSFAIKAFEGGWNETNMLSSPPNRGGMIIDLGIYVTDPTFNHCEMVFAVETCTFQATMDTGTLNYTLFTHHSGCSNELISLDVGFQPDYNIWTLSHVLFLLGSVEETNARLFCTVHTCPKNDAESTCSEIAGQCLESATALDQSTCSSGPVEEPITCTAGEIADNYTRGDYDADCPYCYKYKNDGPCMTPTDFVVANAGLSLDGYTEMAEPNSQYFDHFREFFNVHGISVAEGQTLNQSSLRFCPDAEYWLWFEEDWVDEFLWNDEGWGLNFCHGVSDTDCGCPERVCISEDPDGFCNTYDNNPCAELQSLSGKFEKLCYGSRHSYGDETMCLTKIPGTSGGPNQVEDGSVSAAGACDTDGAGAFYIATFLI